MANKKSPDSKYEHAFGWKPRGRPELREYPKSYGTARSQG